MNDLTFEQFDKLDRWHFAENLTQAITHFSPMNKGAYVLSLNGAYGSGKTTFLRMWQDSLEKLGHQVFYINAWEADFDEEPLVHIISKLLDSLPLTTHTHKAKAAMKEALVAGAIVGNQVLAQVTGIDIYAATTDAKMESDIQKAGQELYKTFGFKRDAYKHLNEQLAKYVAGLKAKPLIILVDELDRVRPNYAVKFLETIKHIFSVDGICFVLAVDRSQLERSVKWLYGEIDFENYYLRFVTREAALPAGERINRNDYATHLWEQCILEPEKRGAIFSIKEESKDAVLATLVSASNAFKLHPRQMERLFHIFSHLMALTGNRKSVGATWTDAAIILLAISLDDPGIYARLGKGEMMSMELYEYLSKLHVTAYREDDVRWLKTIAIAFNTSNEKQVVENSLKAYAKVEQINIDALDEQDRRQLFNSLNQKIGHMGFGPVAGFKQIYSRIEEWRTFY